MNLPSLSRHSALLLSQSAYLKNRVVVPPMASGLASEAGSVTEALLAHYARLSEAGAGIVIVEYTFVHPSGRSEARQLGITEDGQIEGLSLLAAQIHKSGSLAGIQLTHSGAKSSAALTGDALMAPSAVAVPVKGERMETPREMSHQDILLWKEAFWAAAERALQAGFDLVELHSAHGYGLNQWLSPLTNKRDDEYGGSALARFRLLREIVEGIRVRFPRLLLSVRIPGRDFLEAGMQIEESVLLARELESLGVNVIHVSSGIGGWRRPGPRVGEGYLVEEAVAIQSAIEIPVIGVGGIETGAYIDQQIAMRRVSLAAVGRAILGDPKGWGERNLTKVSERAFPAIANCV